MSKTISIIKRLKNTGYALLKNLVQLKKEFCANGKSVPCTLGIGDQGHWGLVTYDATYTHINNKSAFVYPDHPAPSFPNPKHNKVPNLGNSPPTH